jgi:hypothetical protein
MASESERLMRDIKRYLERTGWKASTFGQHVNGDRGLISRIEAGTVMMATLTKVRQFMIDNPPPKKRKTA